MKRHFFLLIFFISALQSFAQPSEEQRIQDSVLGWWSIQDIKNIPQAHESHGHIFTVKTQMDMKNMIEWMKKSYTPVGGLGWFKRKFYVDESSNLPHSYGIDFRVWNVSFLPDFLDEKGHFKPVAEEYTSFGVNVNTVIGINSIDYMSTLSQYVFTWQPDGFQATAMDKINRTNIADPRKHPNLNKYITRITDKELTVYLAPNNALPLVQVTKGEYLKMAEQGIDRKILQEKEDLKNKWPGDVKAQNNAFEYIKNDLERYRTDIKKWMEVYKNNLNEPAVVRDMQPNIRSFYLDPFIIDAESRKLKHYYPVYKIDAATLEKCKADKPQWVAVSFPIETKEDGNQQYELYRAMLEHFNYEYIYNYYFNPEKIKGIPYKPVNEALLNATLDGYLKKSHWQYPTSTTAKAANNSLPANVYFMDNFAGDTPGSKPAGWFFSSIGEHSVVTTFKDHPGNWIQLGYSNEIKSTSLKTPLPQNFTLEYDVATSDFTGRYGGSVILNLDSWSANSIQKRVGNRASVKIEIGAGNENDFNNNNYGGYVSIELNKVPEVNEQNFSKGATYKNELREFTNKKNKVHLVLKINNGELTVMIDNKKIVTTKDMKLAYGGDCTDCRIPVGLKFNTISWKNTTIDSGNVKVYISNVKIMKE